VSLAHLFKGVNGHRFAFSLLEKIGVGSAFQNKKLLKFVLRS
jgi:hypothetical protein